jgi:hypothetical protein
MTHRAEFIERYDGSIRWHNGAVWIDWTRLHLFKHNLAHAVRKNCAENRTAFSDAFETTRGISPTVYFENVQPVRDQTAYNTEGLPYQEAFAQPPYRLVTSVAEIDRRRTGGKYTRLVGRSVCPPTTDEVTLKVPPALEPVPAGDVIWFSGVWNSDREEIAVHSFSDENPGPGRPD